jgi:peptidoglycan/LPS O-acetylase OafA/YrhL
MSTTTAPVANTRLTSQQHESLRTSATGRTRVTGLDGLRAFALLIIMGYHFGIGALPGGFFSLDIFYVLSGYLITGLLLGECARHSKIAFTAFWLRRARRLLPALCLMLIVVCLLIRIVEPAGLYSSIRMSALSALLYFSNWWQIATSGNYFSATGPPSPLTHTWSLSVEEQFYLIWPLVVGLVLWFTRRRRNTAQITLVVSIAGIIASASAMALSYHHGVNTTRLYFGTDTHAQSILIGCALACVLTMVQHKRGLRGMAPQAHTQIYRRLLTALGLLGLTGTLLLTCTMTGTSSFDYHGGFLLSALFAAAIVTCLAWYCLLRSLSVALPGIHLCRPRSYRLHRPATPDRPLHSDNRPRRLQLVRGRTTRHRRPLLAFN